MILLASRKGLKKYVTATVNSEQWYLVAYGSAGLMGYFKAAEIGTAYQRGTLVNVHTERGREQGRVLAQTGRTDNSEANTPGQILGLVDSVEQCQPGDLQQNCHNYYDDARQLLNEQGLSAKIIDIEIIAQPETVVCHLLRYDGADCSALQAALAALWQRRVLLHDISKPVDHEDVEEQHGCSSCGKTGGCGTGGCQSGGCCSRKTGPEKFQRDWQEYFAELRRQMDHTAE